MAQYRIIDLIKEDYPRIWWMAFLPSVLFYGMLAYLFVCWLGYRADVHALEERYQQAKLEQTQRRNAERYKQQLKNAYQAPAKKKKTVSRTAGRK